MTIFVPAEYQGDSTELIYLRARYYNPADGRFQSRDTWEGFYNRPLSLNHWNYVEGNPIGYVDPTGYSRSIGDILLEDAKGFFRDPIGHTLPQIQKNQSMPWECTDVGQIAIQAAPAVAPLIILAATPMLLVSPDSAFDYWSMILDHQEGDYRAFALDAAALMIPGVVGLGTMSHMDDAYRAANSVDEITDVTRYADNCFNSFSADTDVATAEGVKDISLVEIGEYVLAWDEETDSLGWYQVTDTIHHTDEVVVYLNIDGEELETTPEHPFYVEDKGWVKAKDLKVGDKVRNAKGKTGAVKKVAAEETSQEMYNLTVDEAHTFYVGDGQWLVHNTGLCDQILGNMKNPNLTWNDIDELNRLTREDIIKTTGFSDNIVYQELSGGQSGQTLVLTGEKFPLVIINPSCYLEMRVDKNP